MTPPCPGPDPSLGVALRLTQYASCEARALGENGFLALAGGSMGVSLLTSLVTIFIALIGYRMLLGAIPNIGDGVGWAVRLGIVLALVTSWTAFETLIYKVAVDGPMEVAAVLLPSSGLPSADLSGRIQGAYDTLRLGTVQAVVTKSTAPSAEAAAPASSQLLKFQSPLPNTASLLVISTIGILAALQIAIGFLLAIAPLPLMSLLFRGTSGLFNGWLRALAGAAFAMVAASIVTAIDLLMVESELGRLQSLSLHEISDVVDPQALTTIVALFAFVMLILVLVAMKMASALKLPGANVAGPFEILNSVSAMQTFERLQSRISQQSERVVAEAGQSRVDAVAEILSRTAHRESLSRVTATSVAPQALHLGAPEASPLRNSRGGIGLVGRKAFSKNTRSSVRRDQRA